MKVQCPRCQATWVAEPAPYPTTTKQSKHECSTGDLVFNCPKCGRGYFKQDDGTFRCEPDRILIIKETR